MFRDIFKKFKGLKTKVVLRNQRDEYGLRYLDATLNENGDIVIEGQDLGKGVEEAFSSSEYEWTWTIKSNHIHLLKKALGGTNDILDALEKEYSGLNASKLYEFLENNKIPIESYSRIGD